MSRENRGRFLRDTIVATALLASLYGLAHVVQFAPLQIPGYLLLLGFATVGGAVGPEALFPVVFGLYLVLLGAVGAAAVHVLQRALPDHHVAGWRLGVAGALGVTGAISLLFTLVAFGTSQLDAVASLGIAALVCLVLAGWFAGLLTVGPTAT